MRGRWEGHIFVVYAEMVEFQQTVSACKLVLNSVAYTTLLRFIKLEKSYKLPKEVSQLGCSLPTPSVRQSVGPLFTTASGSGGGLAPHPPANYPWLFLN